MPKPQNYKQCEVTRLVINSDKIATILREVSWVPSAFAKKNKAVTIDGMAGTWVVTQVYDGVRTLEQLNTEYSAQKDFEDVLEPHR